MSQVVRVCRRCAVTYLPWAAPGKEPGCGQTEFSLEEWEHVAQLFVCKPCHEASLVGWHRMKTKEAELLESGMHPKMVSRVLTQMVRRGEFA